MQIRVLLALDEAVYCAEVVSAFERHRPHAGVRTVDPRDITLEALRFRPHLVVFDATERGMLFPCHKWACVPLYRRVPSIAIVQVGGSYRRVENIGLEDLLAIADEVEEHILGNG